MQKKMSLEHAVEAFAGAMVLLSLVLTYFVPFCVATFSAVMQARDDESKVYRKEK